MKRTLVKIVLVVGGVVAAAAIVLGGGVAIADRVAGPHAMHRRIHQFIAGAVEAARPDAAQKKALEAARDKAMSQLRGIHQNRMSEGREALALFEADKLDGARVEQIKAARLGEMKQAGDAIVTALTEVHDVLRPEQRRAVAAYLRANRPSDGPGFRGKMMKRFASARLDDMLDEIDANDAQRTAIEAARDHVFAAFDENVAGLETAVADKALALFEADRVDQAQVAAMRADHQAKANRVADALVQALHDVHDALTPAQRKHVTDEVRSRMARMGRHHRGFGHGGPGAPVEGEPAAVDGQ